MADANANRRHRAPPLIQTPNQRWLPAADGTNEARWLETAYVDRRHVVHTNAADGKMRVDPIETTYRFRTDCRLPGGTDAPRCGLMLVGWGGNNGSTVTAAVLANRRQLKWRTKEGTRVCIDCVVRNVVCGMP